MAQTLCSVYEIRFSKSDGVNFMTIGKQLAKLCKKFKFQEEMGDTGYEHFGGRVSLIKQRRKTELLKLFKDIPPPQYLEPTLTVEHQKVAFYHLKEDTKVDGPWTEADFREEEIFMPYQYDGILEKLYPYQRLIYDKCNVREPRFCNVLYDPKGNSGKSSIASIMEIMKKGYDMPPINDGEKLIQAACNMWMDRERDPKCVFIDMPRSLDKSRLYGIYTAIEQIKKGKVYDVRYSYRKWWFHSPQVWVFTNVPPDTDCLSFDRWKIWVVNESKELMPYIEENITLSPLDQK